MPRRLPSTSRNQQRCVYGRTTGRGVELLDDPEVKPDIRDRLRANLFLGSGE